MTVQSSQTLRNWWYRYRCSPALMLNYPFPVPGGWDYMPVAREAVPVWAAVSQIMLTEPYLFRESAGGTYNCRKNSQGFWSLHAYGTAIDINPKANPQKRPLTYNYPSTFIKRMEGIRADGEQAIAWGGRWKTVAPDAMHWQINCAPSDCRGAVTWDKGEPVADGPNGEPNWDEVSDYAKDAWTAAHKAGILTDSSHPKDVLEVEQLMPYLKRLGLI
jgi:hypothetical protein